MPGFLTMLVWGAEWRSWWKWFGCTHGRCCFTSVFPGFHRSRCWNRQMPNWWFKEQQVHVSWLLRKNKASLSALLPLVDKCFTSYI